MNNTSIITSVAVAIALVVVISSFFFSINIFSIFSPTTNPLTQVQKTTAQNLSSTQTTIPAVKKLSITDTVVGTGTIAEPGDTIFVTYVGKLANGKVFDSSKAHGGKPFSFVLGAGKVISGWDEGLVGMKIGGTRILTIPPEFGYGSRATGAIPANSELIFEVKLLNVVAPKK